MNPIYVLDDRINNNNSGPGFFTFAAVFVAGALTTAYLMSDETEEKKSPSKEKPKAKARPKKKKEATK